MEGVDVLFVGPGDLSVSYGTPMEFRNPTLLGAMDRVAAAVAKAGKWWGTTTGTPEAAQEMVDRGARMITCVVDHVFLLQGFQQSIQEFRLVSLK